jgi:isoquinoline 1-oxidoreductase alpha subunit
MAPIPLTVNHTPYQVDERPSTPLLWVLQIKLGYLEDVLPCGIDHCGECTVSVDGVLLRACKTPLARAAGSAIHIEESPDRPGA